MIKHWWVTVKRVHVEFGIYSMCCFIGNNTMYMQAAKVKIACNEGVDMIY